MHKPLQRFMLGVLVFFPLTFFVWYVTAAFHLAPVTLLSELVLNGVVPDALMWLRLDGYTLVVASNFGHDAVGQVVSPPVGEDVLGFHLNPLIYSYSLPLVAALILATPGQDKWLNLLWGILLVLPAEVFSMVSSVLKTLTFDVGHAFQVQQGISQLGVDAIALGYQVGTLLLPMIVPLIVWVGLNRAFIVRLAPQLEQVFR
ncbi:exosortase H-associated membrane protein [Candidatus Thiothrix anitrata]|uniref:Uncharacterized protein n=1 Tax=Candidatus Thiothrix anitrata TaxID=2823902 RepID=A0ABX7X7K1_9GAMM|nr:exosortase H-associated membrane protein [Candidatus Thiothrix anitrata]QTR50219.1 hypothetical protein J8380_01140 [Candidatus Thiothrix anitrata]